MMPSNRPRWLSMNPDRAETSTMRMHGVWRISSAAYASIRSSQAPQAGRRMCRSSPAQVMSNATDAPFSARSSGSLAAYRAPAIPMRGPLPAFGSGWETAVAAQAARNSASSKRRPVKAA